MKGFPVKAVAPGASAFVEPRPCDPIPGGREDRAEAGAFHPRTASARPARKADPIDRSRPSLYGGTGARPGRLHLIKTTIPPVHPLAELIPSMDEAEFAALVDDIRENGQIEPITLYEGKILDGRHRARACAKLGITPKFKEYDGDKPASFVVSLNVKRRHLEKSVLAVIALEFLPHFKAEGEQRKHEGQVRGGEARGSQLAGTNTHKLLEPRDTIRARDEAGAMVGVSGELVGVAERVRRDRPDLYAEVKRGERTITSAANEIRKEAADKPSKRAEILSNAAVQKMAEICGGLNGTVRELEKVNVPLAAASCPREVVRGWIRILETVDRVCRNARKTLTEEVSK